MSGLHWLVAQGYAAAAGARPQAALHLNLKIQIQIQTQIQIQIQLQIAEIEEEARSKHIARLDFFKTIRASVEEVDDCHFCDDDDYDY